MERKTLERKTLERKTLERVFRAACAAAVALPLFGVILLLGACLVAGAERLDLSLLTQSNLLDPATAGLWPDLVGSLALLVMTGLVALPIGIGAAIYLIELAPVRRSSRFTELLIANLAAVPPVVYGLFGLTVFVRTLGLGRSLIAGALTLSLIVLPTVTLAAIEALRTVPRALREASLALGASRWDTVRQVVLPTALPGILTGAILALGRALGEGAALLVLGGFAWVSAAGYLPGDPLAALPLRLFFWAAEPSEAHLQAAAAGVMVLFIVLVSTGGAAVWLRGRAEAHRV